MSRANFVAKSLVAAVVPSYLLLFGIFLKEVEKFFERFCLLFPAAGGLETYAAPHQLLGRSSHVRQAHVSPAAGGSRILLGLLPEGVWVAFAFQVFYSDLYAVGFL